MGHRGSISPESRRSLASKSSAETCVFSARSSSNHGEPSRRSARSLAPGGRAAGRLIRSTSTLRRRTASSVSCRTSASRLRPRRRPPFPGPIVLVGPVGGPQPLFRRLQPIVLGAELVPSFGKPSLFTLPDPLGLAPRHACRARLPLERDRPRPDVHAQGEQAAPGLRAPPFPQAPPRLRLQHEPRAREHRVLTLLVSQRGDAFLDVRRDARRRTSRLRRRCSGRRARRSHAGRTARPPRPRASASHARPGPAVPDIRRAALSPPRARRRFAVNSTGPEWRSAVQRRVMAWVRRRRQLCGCWQAPLGPAVPAVTAPSIALQRLGGRSASVGAPVAAVWAPRARSPERFHAPSRPSSSRTERGARNARTGSFRRRPTVWKARVVENPPFPADGPLGRRRGLRPAYRAAARRLEAPPPAKDAGGLPVPHRSARFDPHEREPSEFSPTSPDPASAFPFVDLCPLFISPCVPLLTSTPSPQPTFDRTAGLGAHPLYRNRYSGSGVTRAKRSPTDAAQRRSPHRCVHPRPAPFPAGCASASGCAARRAACARCTPARAPHPRVGEGRSPRLGPQSPRFGDPALGRSHPSKDDRRPVEDRPHDQPTPVLHRRHRPRHPGRLYGFIPVAAATPSSSSSQRWEYLQCLYRWLLASVPVHIGQRQTRRHHGQLRRRPSLGTRHGRAPRMAAHSQPARKAAERADAGGPQPSSHTPSTAQRAGTTRLVEWPMGGTDELSHEVDHLIREIDEVFGFARPSLARRGTKAVLRS